MMMVFQHQRTTLEDAWNSSYMRNVPNDVTRRKTASCLKCYKEEEAGHLSKRNWETQYWGKPYDSFDLVKETAQDGALDPKIRYIDLRMGTKCSNLLV